MLENTWGPCKGKYEPQTLFLPRLECNGPVKIVAISDAAEPKNDETYRGKWHGCFAIGIMEDQPDGEKFALIHFKAGLTRRVSNSSFDGESLMCIEAADVALWCSDLVSEFEFGLRPTLYETYRLNQPMEDTDTIIPIESHTDCKDFVDATRSLTYTRGLEKRRRGDVFDVQDLQERNRMREIVKIFGETNPTDAGTKRLSFEDITMERLRELTRGFYKVDLRAKEDKVKGSK